MPDKIIQEKKEQKQVKQKEKCICLSPNRTTPQTAWSREGDRRNPSEIKDKCCRQRSDVFILDVLLPLRQGYVEIQYQTN